MAAPRPTPKPAPIPRTRNRHRITAPELEQFVVVDVQLTGVTLGAGAYGCVEEVEIPGARIAAKKLHTQLINLGSPQQVLARHAIGYSSISGQLSCTCPNYFRNLNYYQDINFCQEVWGDVRICGLNDMQFTLAFTMISTALEATLIVVERDKILINYEKDLA